VERGEPGRPLAALIGYHLSKMDTCLIDMSRRGSTAGNAASAGY
jgi:hypothetical protein